MRLLYHYHKIIPFTSMLACLLMIFFQDVCTLLDLVHQTLAAVSTKYEVGTHVYICVQCTT